MYWLYWHCTEDRITTVCICSKLQICRKRTLVWNCVFIFSKNERRKTALPTKMSTTLCVHSLECFSSYLYEWIAVFVKLKVKNRFTGITSTSLAEVINLSIVNKQATVASCGAVYCNRSCLCVCCGSVTTITQICMHRSSPNWVCRWPSPAD